MCRTSKVFARLILPLLLPTLVIVPAVAAQPEAITINSQLIAKSRPLSPPSGTPPASASLLLLAGGNGVLNLDANGDIQELQGNFLIRSGYRFLSRGLNVAMLDAAPTFPDPNGFNNQRHTHQHADLVGKALETVRTVWPSVPVWLVGTSNGTISVANVAARAGLSLSALKGIILTSSVTQPANTPGASVMNLNPGLSSIKVPTLVIWHSADSCPGSPNGGAHAVYASLTGLSTGMKAETVIKGGGWVAMPGCSALGYHGYSGAEDDVVTAIAKFISAHP
jgi:hypothetical protein